jgi:acyl transferase domain-containing protein/acyl carrier protein
MSEIKNNTNEMTNDIAVIGMAGRFPGADNISELWDNLINNRETIKHFTDEEIEPHEFNYESLKNNPNYIKSRGILNNIDKLDAAFFNLNPKEAALIDPQQRVWLEIAWEALEVSGYSRERTDILIGVFTGSGYNNYIFNNILHTRADVDEYVRFRGKSVLLKALGNDVTYISTRTSYKFNLKGPSVTIQTACSTSLVTIAMACQSLLNYESDICIAGGICISVPQETGYIYQRDAMNSKDGHCRSFDADCAGTVFSNGGGAVVLKRLNEAIEDRDNILAVIKGSAVNNDGSIRMSFTAPSVDGQAQVMAAALSMSGVDPETITYVEAHGTGTPLGDPIEVAALNKVYISKTDVKQFCGIGSIKSNIGHLDAGAGVAGFIKAVLCLQHKQIPATLHYKNPNPEIDFKNSPFYVVDKLSDWNPKGFPRRVAVNSSGFGGTNAHAILEEAPEVESDVQSKPYHLLVLSAKTGSALDASIENLQRFLNDNPDIAIADVAYTLAAGRKDFDYRCIITGKDEDLKAGVFFNIVRGKIENNSRDIDTKKDVMALLNKTYDNITDWELFLSEVGKLWLSGELIDWKVFYSNERRRFVELPTYPFERKRYWIDPPPNKIENAFSKIETFKKNQYKDITLDSIAEEFYSLKSSSNDTDKDMGKQIYAIIKDILVRLSEINPQQIDDSTTFIAYGFDSIFLAGFAAELQNIFKIDITFRQLFADYPNIKKLAEFVESNLSGNKDINILSHNQVDSNMEKQLNDLAYIREILGF